MPARDTHTQRLYLVSRVGTGNFRRDKMRRIANAVLVVLLLTACSTTEPVPRGLPGTYTLVTIDGQAVQALLAAAGWGTESSVLTIRADGTYSETILYKRPAGWNPPETEATIGGVWSDSSGVYNFAVTSGLNSPLPQVGTLSGRSLILRVAQGGERGYQK